MLAQEHTDVSSQAGVDDVDHYTSGACHIFAIALNQRFGWPILVLCDVRDAHWRDPEDPDNIIPGVFHAYAVDDEGYCWDIRGATHRNRIWEETDIPEAFRESFEAETPTELDWLVGFHAGGIDDDLDEPIDRPLESYTSQDVTDAIQVSERTLDPLFRQSPSPA